jgi:putative ABC transport system permease protein
MAARLFPNQDPLGQHILVPQILPGRPGLGDDVAYQVIGVVGNERTTALTDEATQGLYGALDQHGLYNPSLAVRAAVDPQSLQQSIRQAIDTINRDQVLSDVRTMDQIKAESVVGARFQTTLLTVFSGLALLLAAIGIYGVFSYSVAEQTHEIGLRAALGASPGRVMRNVLARGLVLAMMGLALGAVGSLVVTRLLATLLYGVGERDPVTLVSAAVCVVMVSLLACYVPARRATRIDPLVAFRQE